MSRPTGEPTSCQSGVMAEDLTLRMERALQAPRGRVFTMLVESDLVARWWGPKGFSVPRIEMDVRVGGAYRIEMQPPEGASFALAGEFREVDPPTRLAYTFRWNPPDPDDRETVATVSLRDLGDSTMLTLEHGVFATEGRRAVHHDGWTDSLDRLSGLLTSP